MLFFKSLFKKTDQSDNYIIQKLLVKKNVKF